MNRLGNILEKLLPPGEVRDGIRGDLDELLPERRATLGRARAARWYVLQMLVAVVRYAPRRARSSVAFLYGKDDPRMNNQSTLQAIGHDAKYALRAIRRDRSFFIFATLIIGLGVGAATSVFSVMGPLILQPLPFEAPERLVLITQPSPNGGMSAVTSRTSNVRDFRQLSTSFEGIAGFNAFFDQQSYNLTGGEPERLVGVNVTGDFLDLLGVAPAVGRNFDAGESFWEGNWGQPPAMILTHGFWTRRFGADPSIVGRSLTLNDQAVSVVGVLPEWFDFSSVFAPTAAVDFLFPWPISDATDSNGNTTTMVARLRPGVSIAGAQSELDAILTGLQEADPERWGLSAQVNGLQEQIARPYRSGMFLLASAAGLMMLIVCVNLSNMLLARSPRRRREMAVRQTLGATRKRLVRQLLIESVAVSLSGAVVGTGLAFAVTRFVSTRSGLDIPMLSSISLSAGALVFMVAIAVVAGLAVGAVPALQVSEGGEAKALGGTARGSGGSRGANRFREMLVVAQIAMACVLLLFGGLVVRSFQRVMEVDLGFEASETVVWKLGSSRPFETLAEVTTFYNEIVASVGAVPGVEAVGLVDQTPLGTNRSWGTRVIDKQYADGEGEGFFPHMVDPGYFAAMRITLVEGRSFTVDDTDASQWVAIVNETAARSMFPNGRAVGRFITSNNGDAQVIGVVADVKHRGAELDSGNEIYFPMAQMWAFSTLHMVVRSPLPTAALVGPVSAAITAVEAEMPTEDVVTLTSAVETSLSPRRFMLQLLVAFALSALLLAGIGVFGVLSYSVTERIPEIGIRMALGESSQQVGQNIVGRTAALATGGILIGVGVSLGGNRLMGSLLFGVEPTDPVTFAVVIAVLMTVALLSGLIPAIRAARTDPARALGGQGQ